MRKIWLQIIFIVSIATMNGCGKNYDSGCDLKDSDFDECIHDKADIKFNDQEIIDYFFAAGEGSWWAFHTYVEDTFGNVLFDCYDTLHIERYGHGLDMEESYSREIYQLFYSFTDKGWNCSLVQNRRWEITVTAEKEDIYFFQGSINGQGRGLGSIFKYNDAYYTGHTNFGWEENNILEYQQNQTVVVNGVPYQDVWSNYLDLGNTSSIEEGGLVCYFAKGVGLVKMVNFHGNDGWETDLIDYEIINP